MLYTSVTGGSRFYYCDSNHDPQKTRKLVQAGAGIVYDSDAENEYQETVNKAKLMTRIGEEG